MLPSSSELQYFVEVASTLNISRAAERLGISQPTLSLAIQRLESSFGTPLLIRGKTGVKLTQAGQRFAGQARELLHEWEKLRGDALRNDSQVGGRYTIGCHPSVALYSLPAFLPKLVREHPRLELRLVHDLSRRITEDVISFRIDFGIVVNPTKHPDLVIKKLGTDEVSLWIGPNPHASDVLICDPDLIQTQSIMKQLARHGFNFSRVISSSNLEVIASLAASGAGVAVLPARVATRIRELRLRPASKSTPKFFDELCLIYRADAQRSKTGRTIAQRIERELG